MRQQLLLLFALLLAAATTVLVLDEYAQYRARQSLESLQVESLGRVRALKNEFRVREQQMDDEYRSKRDDFERQRPELQ